MLCSLSLKWHLRTLCSLYGHWAMEATVQGYFWWFSPVSVHFHPSSKMYHAWNQNNINKAGILRDALWRLKGSTKVSLQWGTLLVLVKTKQWNKNKKINCGICTLALQSHEGRKSKEINLSKAAKAAKLLLYSYCSWVCTSWLFTKGYES